MLKRMVKIVNTRGLHARSAAKIVAVAQTFDCKITLVVNQKTADCSSMMALMILAAGIGTSVQVQCEGQDEEIALDAVCALINTGFDEED